MNTDFRQQENFEMDVAGAQGGISPQEVGNGQNVANPYAALEAELQGIFGRNFRLSDEASQDLLIKSLYNNREQCERLVSALERDPRLAQMLVDVLDGRRNAHSALARYFGRSLMELDEDTPEFEEMMIADEERREEVYRLAENRREYEANLQASRPVIEAFCNQRGYQPSDFMEMIWEKLVLPILSGNYSYDVCVALDHAITYDKDVQDAFSAGDIKGRNTNIQRMKEELGDGMPKGLNSIAPENTGHRQKVNPLIEAALNA